jgi:polygalacturonase
MLAITAALLLFMTFGSGSVRAQSADAGKNAGNDAGKDISWYIHHAPFSMPDIVQPSFPDRSFHLPAYGATGDGRTLNTLAFAKAIQACSAAGGGQVVVPAGHWLTGPIELLSHVELHLEQGAEILFTKDHNQYPFIQGHGGSVSVTPPVYGHDLEDVAITGEGLLDGAGETWRPVKKGKTTETQWRDLLASGGVLSTDGQIWWPTREARDGESFLKDLKKKNPQASGDDYLRARDFLRPVMVNLVNCHHVLIRGVTIRNSPKFVFYPNNCTDLTMDHVNIYNDWWAQNGDGIDISACKKVVIYKCTVNAGDDGICMKSSGARPGGAALEDIVIAGCTVLRAHGGFVVGSNTDGGMHNIFVSDCTFSGTDVGLRFKSNMGRGGLVNNIFIRDITMRNIVNEAVLFDTYYEDQPAGTTKDPNKPKPEDKTPEFRDFHISHITCNGARTAISITGLPQMPVSKISFDSMEIHSIKGLIATQAKEIDLHDVKLITGQEPVYQADKTAEIRVH